MKMVGIQKSKVDLSLDAYIEALFIHKHLDNARTGERQDTGSPRPYSTVNPSVYKQGPTCIPRLN